MGKWGKPEIQMIGTDSSDIYWLNHVYLFIKCMCLI